MRTYPIIIAAFFLTSCASLPERPPVADVEAAWSFRQAALTRLQSWDLRGRLAMRTEETGAHASLHWVREQRMHRMNLAGPFGGGRVRVIYNDDSAELRDASGEVYRGASVQEVLARATGWWLPLEGLNYWVLGLPEPGVPAVSELDQWGRLKTLTQEGWHIDFLEYTQGGGLDLPKRVFISRKPNGKEVLEARIAIEQWVLPQVAARR